MAIDPSIYASGPVAPIDPIETTNKLLELKKAKQELDFRQGLSEAESEASNEDGTQDTGKFNQLIMKDPRTAWKAQEMLLQGNRLNAPEQYQGYDASNAPQVRMVAAQNLRGLMSPQQKALQKIQQDPDAHHDRIDAVSDTMSPAFVPSQT